MTDFGNNLDNLKHLLYTELFTDPYWRSKEISSTSTFAKELNHTIERLDLEIKHYKELIRMQSDTIMSLTDGIVKKF